MTDMRRAIMDIIRDNVFYQTGRRPTAFDPMGEGWVGVDRAADLIINTFAAIEAADPAPLDPVRAKALELALGQVKPGEGTHTSLFARADRFMAYLTGTHEEDRGNENPPNG